MSHRAVAPDAMNRSALAAALVAGLVLLAGCSSGFAGSSDGTATGESALDGETTAEEIQGDTGTVNMYISDEENAIEDFEHLNVTITRVGVKPAGDGTEDAEGGDAAGNETAEDANTTESVETDTGTPEAGADTEDAEETDEVDEDEEDEAGDEEEDEAGDEEADGEDAEDGDDADDAEDADDGESEWVEYEVDNRTVDLTELKGANATKLSSLDVPNGSYETVFVYVSDVNGTLKDGTNQRVKLPSGKLQLNSEFTVGNGEEVDFVFDITAVKAGNSGKYILKPVISQSGTDVEIDDIDERDDDEERDEDDERDDDEDRGANERDEDREAELNASFDGDVVAGENATLRVTDDGDPVDGATVFVDGERAGTTDANGTYVVGVPEDAEELEVKVTHEGAEAEVDAELEGASDDDTTDTADDDPDGAGAADGSQQRLTVG